VRLVAVDDAVLGQLVVAATTDAAADEVTPPLTAGPGWSVERVDWLRRYHRDRRPGLDGPLGEATWAVVGPDGVLGAVRLQRTAQPGSLTTGVWLRRSARATGRGRAAVEAVLEQAAALGAHEVHAETTARNGAATALLRALGFQLGEPDPAGGVRAGLVLPAGRGAGRPSALRPSAPAPAAAEPPVGSGGPPPTAASPRSRAR